MSESTHVLFKIYDLLWVQLKLRQYVSLSDIYARVATRFWNFYKGHYEMYTEFLHRLTITMVYFSASLASNSKIDSGLRTSSLAQKCHSVSSVFGWLWAYHKAFLVMTR